MFDKIPNTSLKFGANIFLVDTLTTGKIFAAEDYFYVKQGCSVSDGIPTLFFLGIFTPRNSPIIPLLIFIFLKSYSHQMVTYFYFIKWLDYRIFYVSCFVILIIVPLKPLVAYTNNVAALHCLNPLGLWKPAVVQVISVVFDCSSHLRAGWLHLSRNLGPTVFYTPL